LLGVINFYNGDKSPFAFPHNLCGTLVEKPYAEIVDDFIPKPDGKIAVGSWVVGKHKNKAKRFAGEVIKMIEKNQDSYLQVKNVKTGKARMMLLALAIKCHQKNAYIRVCCSCFSFVVLASKERLHQSLLFLFFVCCSCFLFLLFTFFLLFLLVCRALGMTCGIRLWTTKSAVLN